MEASYLAPAGFLVYAYLGQLNLMPPHEIERIGALVGASAAAAGAPLALLQPWCRRWQLQDMLRRFSAVLVPVGAESIVPVTTDGTVQLKGAHINFSK